MALCKDTILIVDEYIHRDLYRDVMIQLKWLTADIFYVSSRFECYQINRCRNCKRGWTFPKTKFKMICSTPQSYETLTSTCSIPYKYGLIV